MFFKSFDLTMTPGESCADFAHATPVPHLYAAMCLACGFSFEKTKIDEEQTVKMHDSFCSPCGARMMDHHHGSSSLTML